jgi:hypothetical protein
MKAEILRIINWSPNNTLTQLHDQMIEMLATCFSDNGTSPAMWLVVAPDASEAAVVVTPWRNEREKRSALKIMHDTLMDGPGGGICPMYSFSCEASMRVRSLNDDDDGDEQVEDITFITSYDQHGHGLFTRFGVANAHPHGFGKLLARDDWDLSKPDNEDRLDGLLMNVYRPQEEREGAMLRCAYCHQPARWDNAVNTERKQPRDGDAMLCMGCGEVGVFDKAAPYGSRKASKAELADFQKDLRLRIGSALIKAVQQK